MSDSEDVIIEDSDCDEGPLLAINKGEGATRRGGGSGGYLTSVFTVFNSTVGTGILTLPYSFRMAGAVFGMSLLLLYSVVMACSAYAVVRVADKTNCKSFQQIVRKLLGPRAGVAMSVTIAFYCYLVCIGCLVIVADVAGPLVNHFAGDDSGSGSGDEWYENRRLAIVAGAVLALPPMCLRDFTSLAFTAFLSFAAVVFVVVVVIDKGHNMTTGSPPDFAPEMSPNEAEGSVEWSVAEGYKALYAVPNIALSLQCHIQSPGIYAEVSASSRNTSFFKRVLMSSYLLCVILYSSCAFFGYVTFRDHTPANIMQAGYDKGDPMIIIARFCLLVTAICALPINHHPCRAALRDLLVKKKEVDDDDAVTDDGDRGRKSLLSSSLASIVSDDEGMLPVDRFFVLEIGIVWVTMTAIAMEVPNLAVLNDIIGFTAGVSVMFIFPGLFLLAIDPFHDNYLATYPTLYRGVGYFFVIFGVVTGIIAAFSFVASLV